MVQVKIVVSDPVGKDLFKVDVEPGMLSLGGLKKMIGRKTGIRADMVCIVKSGGALPADETVVRRDVMLQAIGAIRGGQGYMLTDYPRRAVAA
mmetsp:Transcript_6011/g.9238  ORF Transcript_6011/g.9238 Transcript_6011/m.9238 type:complete len:93 (-) Transcript_6011:801-1079(-)|eukprot:CAMPEP_0184657834 /NCGR_PEP_ID=MMETSP0308-20130426/21961_1 /TAXON_ID=38269 /ORGANISM="Gloeochaete witrockiana, Strain SAG 46.84" /LENGTH=92 /DNA_ID=CAMNT_0027096151 /DNA_START=116 /DNA_END=394 /DNA_ORIENTATION=+